MAWYGSKRHPATDTPAPDATGPGVGSNVNQPTTLTYGASRQAVQLAASMAIAVNTASPMAHGARVWAGDPGFGFQGGQRFTNRLPINPADPAGQAIHPIQVPTAVRYGMNYGASQGQGSAYPSTGAVADFGTRAVAAMSMGQLGNLGYGG